MVCEARPLIWRYIFRKRTSSHIRRICLALLTSINRGWRFRSCLGLRSLSFVPDLWSNQHENDKFCTADPKWQSLASVPIRAFDVAVVSTKYPEPKRIQTADLALSVKCQLNVENFGYSQHRLFCWLLADPSLRIPHTIRRVNSWGVSWSTEW